MANLERSLLLWEVRDAVAEREQPVGTGGSRSHGRTTRRGQQRIRGVRRVGHDASAAACSGTSSSGTAWRTIFMGTGVLNYAASGEHRCGRRGGGGVGVVLVGGREASWCRRGTLDVHRRASTTACRGPWPPVVSRSKFRTSAARAHLQRPRPGRRRCRW